ncbi:hypothetical protein IWX49DRAFT_25099 [Phyllosticta citricarpa]|uniref:Zn(2)-C6 fungal-type domain-containing protein n=2 Tax=Phyllosticta TaxID=121621 RepID=A0ABR1MJY5_9PEZI
MAVGSLLAHKHRRHHLFPNRSISVVSPGSLHQGMSYNPSGPVSVTRVAQPLDHSFGLNGLGSDHSPGPHAFSNPALDDAVKKRKSSKGSISSLSSFERTSSTPHMRSLSLGESSSISPNSDKRRNKLGYHRTSVACGHCRRRKIRCLLAPDDPQGRCSNCIRLKKECNFYPVEQQNSNESRAQSAKRSSISHIPSSSTSSSPRGSNPAVGHEHFEEYGSFQSIPPDAPGYPVPHHMDGSVDIKAHHGVIPQSEFPYSPSFDFHGWNQNYAGHTPSDGHSDASSIAYWPSSGPPVTSASPFVHDPMSMPSQMDAQIPQQHFPGHDQPVWPGLQRSMSYGGPETLTQDPRFHNGLPGHVQRHSAHDIPTIEPAQDSEPMNHSPMPPNWQPFVSVPEGTQPGPVQPYNGHWYPEPQGLGSVEEEHNLATPYRPF